MNDYNLLVFYRHNNIDPHSIIVNAHLYSLTLNMHMRYFHSKELIQGMLLSRLGLDAPDSLIEAILDYPQDALDGKDVTVLF